MSFSASRSMEEHGCIGMRERNGMNCVCAYVCFGYVPKTDLTLSKRARKPNKKKLKKKQKTKKKAKTLPYLHEIAYLCSVSSHCNFYHATKDIIKKKRMKEENYLL